MKNKLTLFLTILLTICLWSGMVSAQNSQWLDRQVNLQNIKTVYIDDDVDANENVKINQLDYISAKHNLLQQSKLLKRFKLTNNQEQADAIIEAKILSNGTRSYTVPEKKETVYEKVIMKDKDGKESSVSIPVTKVTPAYTAYNNYFSVEYTLKLKDDTKVFIYVDSREADREFKNMFRRSVKDFYRSLNKIEK